MTACGRKGVDVNHSKNDETRNKEAIGAVIFRHQDLPGFTTIQKTWKS